MSDLDRECRQKENMTGYKTTGLIRVTRPLTTLSSIKTEGIAPSAELPPVNIDHRSSGDCEKWVLLNIELRGQAAPPMKFISLAGEENCKFEGIKRPETIYIWGQVVPIDC